MTCAAAHAEALAHALAELLRFSREGPALERFPFGLDDVSVILSEVLLFTLRTEGAALAGSPDHADERELGSQLCAALAAWITDSTGCAPGDGPEA